MTNQHGSGGAPLVADEYFGQTRSKATPFIRCCFEGLSGNQREFKRWSMGSQCYTELRGSACGAIENRAQWERCETPTVHYHRAKRVPAKIIHQPEEDGHGA